MWGLRDGRRHLLGQQVPLIQNGVELLHIGPFFVFGHGRVPLQDQVLCPAYKCNQVLIIKAAQVYGHLTICLLRIFLALFISTDSLHQNGQELLRIVLLALL